MNLKKAFQYQKEIRALENNVLGNMLDSEKYVQVTETHCKSEVNKMNSAYCFSDETKDLSSLQYGKYEFAKVLKIYQKLVEWRTNLAKGIAQAKEKVAIGEQGLTYDAAITYVNDQRNVLWYYGKFASLENVETESLGTMNVATDMGTAEVNYNVKRNRVPMEGVVELASQKRLLLQTELDELSDAIEAATLGTQIPKECVPPIPLNITPDELYKNFEKYV